MEVKVTVNLSFSKTIKTSLRGKHFYKALKVQDQKTYLTK